MSKDRDPDSATEEATEKRILEAIERGDIPHSRESVLMASLAATLIGLTYVAPVGIVNLSQSLSRLVDDPGGWRVGNERDMLLLISPILMASARFLVPLVCILAVFGVSAAIAQNGLHFAAQRIAPDFSRVSLRAGISRVFGSRGLTEFLKSAAKFLTILSVLALIFDSEKRSLLSAMFIDVDSLPARSISLAFDLVAGALVVMAVLAGVDLVWVRLRWRKDHRMTKEELKEELRQTEGDRFFKARLRSLRLQRARKKMLSAVPNATMVIANPTHYAVALRYVRSEGGAPIVVAKGMNLIALKIREAAEAQGIAVIEDRALARSLYEATAVDHPIPPEFYRAVAEIVFVIQAKKSAWLSRK